MSRDGRGEEVARQNKTNHINPVIHRRWVFPFLFDGNEIVARVHLVREDFWIIVPGKRRQTSHLPG
jgi:hypothetical protein